MDSTNALASASQRFHEFLLSGTTTEAAKLAELVNRLLENNPENVDEITLLEPLARLVCLKPLPQLAAQFANLVVLHMLHPALHQHLLAALKTPLGFAVPSWWPNFDGAAVSLSDVSCISDPAFLTGFLAGFCGLAVEVLNAMQRLDLPVIFAHMNENDAHRELVTAFILHDTNTTAQLLANASEGTALARRKAQIIVDMILSRPAFVCIAATSFSLPGAKMMMLSYTEMQRAAFGAAESDPIIFVLDLLDQGVRQDFSASPVVPTCLDIALHKVESLCRSSTKHELYSTFNSCALKLSLLAVLCDLGYLISCNFLRLCGEDLISLEPLHRIFSHSSLPPVAKPNYFSASAKFTDNEIAESLQTLEEVDGLLRCLVLIMKIVSQVTENEFRSVAATGESVEITKKLVIRNVEHVLGLLLSALICVSRMKAANALAAKNGSTLASKIQETMLRVLAPSDEVLVWITLFNFANDVCYADVRYVPIFEKIFDDLVLCESYSEHQELAGSGILLFFATFNDGSRNNANIDKILPWKKPSKHFVNVPSSEFRFLYGTSPAAKPQVSNSNSRINLTGYTPNSSRQQSVHVDKFGK